MTASGDIRPRRFVKVSGADTIAEADANEAVIGVVFPYSKAFDSALAASDGTQCPVCVAGQIAEIECAGDITVGTFVKSDADGKAVAIATSGTTAQNIGGMALQTGANGLIIRMMIMPQTKVYPALA
jgi:hypothetical protein